MTIGIRRRGAPLAAIGLIVGGWIVARIALLAGGGILPQGIAGPFGPIQEAEAEVVAVSIHKTVSLHPVRRAGVPTSPELSPAKGTAVGRIMADRPWPVMQPAVLVGSAPPTAPPAKPADAAPFFPVPPSTIQARDDKRWSADAWLLLRPDGRGKGMLLARYGASQAGMVLRYRLAPDSGHRPAAYLRAAAALDRPRQKEAALGLSARPLPGFPVVAAAELRLTADRFGTRTRPAVLAYTELPPFDLASGLRGEAYLQGGYVAGKDGTAFVDGQIRVDQALTDLGPAELRLGAGAWGGAQDGAARLDIGPAAQIGFPLAEKAFARLAFDWRFRVAGDAAPASGPALTLSAGF